MIPQRGNESMTKTEHRSRQASSWNDFGLGHSGFFRHSPFGFRRVQSATCHLRRAEYPGLVKGKLTLPIALMIVFALSRIPGMLPQNFSAAYALAFCAGVYFRDRLAWWLPLVTLLFTDVALDIYYLKMGWPVFTAHALREQLFIYVSYAVIW